MTYSSLKVIPLNCVARSFSVHFGYKYSQVASVGDVLQAKLDWEIVNGCSLLNDHRNPIFLMHKFK